MRCRTTTPGNDMDNFVPRRLSSDSGFRRGDAGTGDPADALSSPRCTARAGRVIGLSTHPTVQGCPFSVNAVGAAALEVYVAWKPSVVDAPGARAPLYDTFVAVTAPLDGVYVALQPLVIVWPEGSVKPSDQPLIAAVPVFLIVRFDVNPVFHELIVSVTEHAPEPAGGEVTGGLLGGVVGGVVDEGGVLPSRPKKWIA